MNSVKECKVPVRVPAQAIVWPIVHNRDDATEIADLGQALTALAVVLSEHQRKMMRVKINS